MNPLNSLPEIFQNPVAFFALVVLGFGLLGGVIVWLTRELRGSNRPTGGGGDSFVNRGSAGTTRTMDSSASGIMGSMNRSGRSSQPLGTSLIGSGVSSPDLTDRDRSQIEPELRKAGYYRPTALAEYRSVRALAVLFPLVAAAGISLLVEPAQMPSVMAGGLILSGLGYSVPRVYINLAARRRRREIERGLPTAIDMLVLGLVAGQNIMNSFQRVSVEIRRAFPILSEEMSLAYRQAELDTLGHALRAWADRCGVREVYNLSVILTQSERQGADVSTSLLEFAASYRVTLRQRADAQANRASVWMLFPTLLCMWIPAAVIMVAPVYMEFQERRTKARQSIIPKESNPNDPFDKAFETYLKRGNK